MFKFLGNERECFGDLMVILMRIDYMILILEVFLIDGGRIVIWK